jgi:capsular polysaccharide transport system permease protein
MATTLRTPLQVMRASISALSIRYLQNKLISSIQSRRGTGIIALFFEPVSHILIWMCVKYTLAINTGTTLSTPLFILLGASPFLFSRNIIRQSANIIKNNQKLFVFRQVRPIDPIIATLASELLISTSLFIIFLLVFTWIGIEWHIYHLTYLLLNTCSFIFFLFGLSLIIAVAGFFLRILKPLITLLLHFAYLLSGVFFNGADLPEKMKPFFLSNPLFQYIEMCRNAFTHTLFHQSNTSPIYLFKSGLFSLFFGLGLYIALRKRMMIEIAQR